jgi:hypothetical protein
MRRNGIRRSCLQVRRVLGLVDRATESCGSVSNLGSAIEIKVLRKSPRYGVAGLNSSEPRGKVREMVLGHHPDPLSVNG